MIYWSMAKHLQHRHNSVVERFITDSWFSSWNMCIFEKNKTTQINIKRELRERVHKYLTTGPLHVSNCADDAIYATNSFLLFTLSAYCSCPYKVCIQLGHDLTLSQHCALKLDSVACTSATQVTKRFATKMSRHLSVSLCTVLGNTKSLSGILGSMIIWTQFSLSAYTN